MGKKRNLPLGFRVRAVIGFVASCFCVGVLGTVFLNLLSERSYRYQPNPISTVRVFDDSGHGSGVHIGDGYILTMAHVVAEMKTVKVRASDNYEAPATVLWSNTAYDVALLRTPLRRMDKVPLRCDLSPLKTGDAIEAVGNPYQLEFVHTYGKVSSAVRKSTTALQVYMANIVILPGMSGGPVFDSLHRLTGLVHAVLTASAGVFGGGPVPLSYIVPVSSACALMGHD